MSVYYVNHPSAAHDDVNALQLLKEEPTIAALFTSSAYGSGTWTYSGDPNLPHAQSRSGPASVSSKAAVKRWARVTGPSRSQLRAAAAKRRLEEIWIRP